MEVAAVPAHKLFTRILPAAAVTVGLLVAPAAANAGDKKDVVATIALGDKRPATTKKKRAKASAKASKAPATCANADVQPAAENLEAVRAAILCLHNRVRAEKGLPLLKENPKLRKAAANHSTAMVSEGFFGHTSSNGDTFVDRILGAGYAKRTDGWSLGENLAWGTGDLSSPAGLMDAWMNSAGHKANIVKKAYREIGIGIHLGVPSDASVGATVTTDFGVKS
jgi:uncharacterized protein YkwD